MTPIPDETRPDLADTPLSVETAWDVLERFGLALQQSEQAREQVHLALEAVRDALDAEVVFWQPASGEEGFERAALPGEARAEVVTASWARAFLSHVLSEESGDGPRKEGQLLCQLLDPAAKAVSPWPCSTALVRISRSRDIWLVALSFHPRRLFRPTDLKVMRLARRMLLSHGQQTQVYDRLRDSLFGLVRCLTAAIDAKDPHTWGHSERVARIAVRLGKQMSLPEAVLSDLYLAGLLHDIGKIGIRDSVLRKPTRLTPDEMAHVQEHSLIGDRLVANLRPLHHLRPGVRNHHERYDGKGYPDGLMGEQIPLLARILAVADSCDAMMAARPYRPALPSARIDAIFADGSGSQWDPEVVAYFMACRQELYSICERGLGDSVFAAVERALNLGAPAEPASRWRTR